MRHTWVLTLKTKNMRTKLVISGNQEEFVNDLNATLEQLENTQVKDHKLVVIDIKYQHILSHSFGNSSFSALILYK